MAHFFEAVEHGQQRIIMVPADDATTMHISQNQSSQPRFVRMAHFSPHHGGSQNVYVIEHPHPQLYQPVQPQEEAAQETVEGEYSTQSVPQEEPSNQIQSFTEQGEVQSVQLQTREHTVLQHAPGPPLQTSTQQISHVIAQPIYVQQQSQLQEHLSQLQLQQTHIQQQAQLMHQNEVQQEQAQLIQQNEMQQVSSPPQYVQHVIQPPVIQHSTQVPQLVPQQENQQINQTSQQLRVQHIIHPSEVLKQSLPQDSTTQFCTAQLTMPPLRSIQTSRQQEIQARPLLQPRQQLASPQQRQQFVFVHTKSPVTQLQKKTTLQHSSVQAHQAIQAQQQAIQVQQQGVQVQQPTSHIIQHPSMLNRILIQQSMPQRIITNEGVVMVIQASGAASQPESQQVFLMQRQIPQQEIQQQQSSQQVSQTSQMVAQQVCLSQMSEVPEQGQVVTQHTQTQPQILQQEHQSVQQQEQQENPQQVQVQQNSVQQQVLQQPVNPTFPALGKGVQQQRLQQQKAAAAQQQLLLQQQQTVRLRTQQQSGIHKVPLQTSQQVFDRANQMQRPKLRTPAPKSVLQHTTQQTVRLPSAQLSQQQSPRAELNKAVHQVAQQIRQPTVPNIIRNSIQKSPEVPVTQEQTNIDTSGIQVKPSTYAKRVQNQRLKSNTTIVSSLAQNTLPTSQLKSSTSIVIPSPQNVIKTISSKTYSQANPEILQQIVSQAPPSSSNLLQLNQQVAQQLNSDRVHTINVNLPDQISIPQHNELNPSSENESTLLNNDQACQQPDPINPALEDNKRKSPTPEEAASYQINQQLQTQEESKEDVTFPSKSTAEEELSHFIKRQPTSTYPASRKKKNGTIATIKTPTTIPQSVPSAPQGQQQQMIVLPDSNQLLLQQLISKSDKSLRIVVVQETNSSSARYIIQQVDPSTETDECDTDFAAPVEGVDQFPTGVPQECVVSETGEVFIAGNHDMVANSRLEGNLAIVKEEPKQFSVEVSDDIPKYVPGQLAMCNHCGIFQLNFNRCNRCKYKIQENCKTQSALSSSDKMSNKKIVLNSDTTITGTSPLRGNNVATVVFKKDVILSNELDPEKALANKVTLLSDNKKRCRAPGRRARSKLPEEPEILTLSSDDEEKSEKKPETELVNGSKTEPTTKIMETDEQDSSDEFRKHPQGVRGTVPLASAAFTHSLASHRLLQSSQLTQGGGMMEQAMDGSIKPPHVIFACRSIRIGSYKAKPIGRVCISGSGMEVQIPLPNEEDSVTLAIAIDSFKQVLVSYSRAMPVMFVLLSGEAGVHVRKLLNMTSVKMNYYFNPLSDDETLKRITFLPEKMSEDFKINVKSIFELNKVQITEITNKLANDMLVRSSPREITKKYGVMQPSDIQTIMVYPPPPAKGGISINTEDYACLGEDQFLNDVIIDFYLKYLMQCVLSEEDRERTHVFSSFFYKRLTSKPKSKGRRSHPVEDNPKLSPAEKRHARVKSWTKSVNLFSKDFIIIPINENCHWFLAIVCFPGLTGCFRMCDNTPIEPANNKVCTPGLGRSVAVMAAAAAAAAAGSSYSKLTVKDNVMSIGSTTITPIKKPATITLDNGEEGSDRDEAEGDEEEMDQPSEEEESEIATEASKEESSVAACADAVNTTNNTTISTNSPTPSVPTSVTPKAAKLKPGQRECIKQPCILIFDSLVGAPRYRVVATLREYLRMEYKAKEGKERDFSKDTIKGMMPKVPQQSNFTDCGLYLLHYVESFFKDPIKDFHYPISSLKEWFPESVVNQKRLNIVQLLIRLMEEQGIDPESLPLPTLTFSSAPFREADGAEGTSGEMESNQVNEGELSAVREDPFDGTDVSEQIIYNSEVLEPAAEEVVGGEDSEELIPPDVRDIPLPQDSEEMDCNASACNRDAESNSSNSTLDLRNDNSLSNKSKECSDSVRVSLVDYSESSSEGLPETNESSSIKRVKIDQDLNISAGNKRRRCDDD